MQNEAIQQPLIPNVKLIECPRDAMQGWPHFIPTEKKVEYINQLVKVGFDTIDFGSFVSAKAIPQMVDTKEVIGKLQLDKSSSKLLCIIANSRGAEEAIHYEEITYLGFPFSISPTFQLRNTNSTIEESLDTIEKIQSLCIRSNKELVVYISMGFGNPYGDVYEESIVLDWVEKVAALEIKIISIADTVGLSEPSQITSLLDKLIPAFPQIEIGVHLHSAATNREQKLDSALKTGCKRFDGALMGIGGCPMADDELVGNMNTELMIAQLEKQNLYIGINKEALQKALALAGQIFR